MRVTADFHFTDLFCVVPNEGADEPFLWLFYLKLDGDTVRQVPNGTAFIANVRVDTAGGSHGNLGATGIRAGSHITVPASMGTYSTTLRPIQLSMLGQSIWVPAQLLAVAVLLEEDDSPDDGIENGHQSLRQYIEQSVNDFIVNLDVSGILAEANQRVAAQGGNLKDHAEAIVKERFAALTQQIRDNAESVITLEVLAAHTPGAIWEFLDADDLIDSNTFQFDERELLNGPGGLTRVLLQELVTRDDGDVEAMYRLLGTLNVSVSASTNDLRESGSGLGTVVGATGSAVFTTETLCTQAGQVAEWQRIDQREEEQFVFPRPFVPLVWTLDGIELAGDTGDVRVQKTCKFPFFDITHPSGPSYRSETRDVVVTFEKFTQDELPGVKLRNRPEDGTYYGMLEVTGVFNLVTRIPLGSASFGFDGQVVTSPFYAEFKQCMDKFESVGEGYAKSKRVTPRDLWGPYGRQRWYEEQVQAGEQLVQAGLLSREQVAAAQQVLRKQLRLG